MRHYYVLDLPIYRCSYDQHDAEMTAFTEKWKRRLVSRGGIEYRKLSKELRGQVDVQALLAFGGTWQFTQVVGWLRLYARPSSIGGELWLVRGKRLGRIIRNRMFGLVTPSDVLGTYFPRNADSGAIYSATLDAIRRFSKSGPMRRRHVDLSNFLRIGPVVDWRELLEQSAVSR